MAHVRRLTNVLFTSLFLIFSVLWYLVRHSDVWISEIIERQNGPTF